MINLTVAGAAGRMGSRISALATEFEGIRLSGGFERADHPRIGADLGEVVGVPATGIKLSASFEEASKDSGVLIDFTAPESTLDNLRKAAAREIAVVIGTTGFSPEQRKEVEEAGKKIPVVLAANMSMGINILLKVVSMLSGALDEDYDIEIIESHHRMKKDAPSGTALALGRAAAEGRGVELEQAGVFERHGMIGERKRGEIGLQTVRAGDIVGEHTVLFGGMGERIEITHKASSRDTFARGALKAAAWLGGKQAGLYDMQDVLGLK